MSNRLLAWLSVLLSVVISLGIFGCAYQSKASYHRRHAVHGHHKSSKTSKTLKATPAPSPAAVPFQPRDVYWTDTSWQEEVAKVKPKHTGDSF